MAVLVVDLALVLLDLDVDLVKVHGPQRVAQLPLDRHVRPDALVVGAERGRLESQPVHRGVCQLDQVRHVAAQGKKIARDGLRSAESRTREKSNEQNYDTGAEDASGRCEPWERRAPGR